METLAIAAAYAAYEKNHKVEPIIIDFSAFKLFSNAQWLAYIGVLLLGSQITLGGGAIATASNDNTAIIWELDLERLLDKSCDWLQFYLRHNPKVRDGDRQLCDPPETTTETNTSTTENRQ